MHTVSLLHGSGLEHGVATWTGLQAVELERVARNQEREAAADAERVARIQQKEAAAEARSSQRLAAAQALLAEKEAARHEAEMHRQAVVRPSTAETQIHQKLRVCSCPFRDLRSVFMISIQTRQLSVTSTVTQRQTVQAALWHSVHVENR